MSVLTALHHLQQPELIRCITHWEQLPPKPPRYAPFPTSLDPRLSVALRAQGIDQLYIHQAAAVEAAQRGEEIVVVTPTASGKTL
ncbi:MAG: ATP-dependent helicase, partial [Ardenticatenales bacterium]|nr:ATP-dependent helicase [Ardenticatenales bacterium]